jgi:hypothetical protein
MKIVLLSTNRSRSTYLANILAYEYCYRKYIIWPNTCPPKELFSNLEPDNGPLLKNWQSDGYSPPREEFIKMHRDGFLSMVESPCSFVIKVHPERVYDRKWNGQLIDIDFLKLDRYDQIYFTYRKNQIESISSFFIAKILNQFAYDNNNPPPRTDLKDIIMPTDSIKDLVFKELWDQLVIEHLRDYVNRSSLNYTWLDYDDIPDWHAKNYSYVLSKNINSVPTKYDYRKIILNYDELEYHLESDRATVKDLFYKQNPQLSRIN